MICYRCNHEAGDEKICPICGTDLNIFHKVIRISNLYYNDGLQKAEVRNLSGAIISLKKSLKFNKYNIDARNLLGLVYYEMGEVVDALSEWVISKSYQQDNNAAGRYLDALHQNRGQLEAINQTIKKYNQALLYCRQDSRDLAIIQLKKVLSLNPRLVRGHQLLALLYLQEGKLEAAKKSLRSAGKIDTNNTRTLRYLKEVNAQLKESGSNKKKKEEDLISYQSGNETIIMPNRFQDTSMGSNLIYMLLGLALGLAVVWFLIVPGIQSDAKKDAAQEIADAKATITENAHLITSLENQVAELQAQLGIYQEQSSVLPSQTTAYESLLSGYAAYNAKDIVMAGMYLEAVDREELSETAKVIYDNIWAEISAKYYDQLYSLGYSSYTAGNYADAVDKLLRVVNYDMAYRNGNATYYLAQAYNRNGDLDSAIPYYQYIVDNYPNSQKAITARNYLNVN